MIRHVDATTDFDFRPLTEDQAGAWAKLLAAIATADNDDEVFSEEDLLEDFANPRHDFPQGSIAVYGGATMVGYSLLDVLGLSAQEPRIHHDGGVHPDCRGRGLGARL